MSPSTDIAIRVSGLLQAIINSGTPEAEWKQKLESALILHSKTCKAILGTTKQGEAK